MLKAMGSGYVQASALNARALGHLIGWLRAAWVFFVASPVVGLIIYLAAVHFL
jgi:hypothetical protein